MKRPVVLALCLFLVAPSAPAQDVAAGAELFQAYCAACHGEDARGSGPMSEILNTLPPDLTILRAGNGGVFPRARTVFRIDGRDPLLAHGGPMPIFGDILGEEPTAMKSETGQPILTGRGIVDLLAWLEGVQQ